MPKQITKLTETQIKSAKPEKGKAKKLFDGENLILLVRPSGTKVWQYPYKLHGKNNVYTIGQYPEVGAAKARELRDEAREMVKKGIAPIESKPTHKLPAGAKNSFGTIGHEWLSKQIWVEKHKSNITRQLDRDIFELLGTRPVRSITRQDLLTYLKRIEDRDALDVAKRTAQHCVQIFDYAMLRGDCDNNPAIGLSKVLKTRKTENRPYLKENQLSDFLKKLEYYPGKEITKLAMKFLMLTMVRPGELRGARWDEFDEAKKEWRIPAERMKMKRPHIVPLSTQAQELLEEIRAISGTCDILFPGNDATKPLSDVTLTKCLIILGYGDGKASAHGMRATASTILNERNFNEDWVECQLAHKPKNKIRAAYNHAEYLVDRRAMLQWYADFLDSERGKCVKGS